MKLKLIKRFLQLESASSIWLFTMTMLAMIWANSPLSTLHEDFVQRFLFLINEGLMAFFFLNVGLELKRSYLEGQFSRFSQVILPAIGALGGMLAPAILFVLINASEPATLKGWAIPVATDIAFAVGTLSLFGARVPIALKLFLLALAIFDDIGAIFIIALWYSQKIDYLALLKTAILMIVLYLMNFSSVRSLLLYLLIGVLLWFSLLHSGIHPTIAGVLLAFMIPDDSHKATSPLRRLEHVLHPWVAYLIMPLFALANAGISLRGLAWNSLADELVLGIIVGLFFGKQIGVFGFSWVLIKLKIAKLPEKSTWQQLYGVAILCGIGFTMSLFLGTLSFQNENIYLAKVRLGVIIASILSGLAGVLVLRSAFKGRAKHS